ncbi:hypothetical protein CHU98_g11792 [Xylaria longipes]|nr:hypothetical protein CHU98_g11792 [Xylaria longipes]
MESHSFLPSLSFVSLKHPLTGIRQSGAGTPKTRELFYFWGQRFSSPPGRFIIVSSILRTAVHLRNDATIVVLFQALLHQPPSVSMQEGLPSFVYTLIMRLHTMDIHDGSTMAAEISPGINQPGLDCAHLGICTILAIQLSFSIRVEYEYLPSLLRLAQPEISAMPIRAPPRWSSDRSSVVLGSDDAHTVPGVGFAISNTPTIESSSCNEYEQAAPRQYTFGLNEMPQWIMVGMVILSLVVLTADPGVDGLVHEIGVTADVLGNDNKLPYTPSTWRL